MSKFGCSLTSHYRLLDSVSNIENLSSYFVKNEAVDILELGFGGTSNYGLFYEAYSRSAILRVANEYKTSVNLHLPRKDWELIGPEKIISDVKSLMQKFKITSFVIHEAEYRKYKKLLTFISSKLYVENNDLAAYRCINGDIKIACDINHFYVKNNLNIKNFNKFVVNNKSRIKEFHFSNQNHDFFNEKNILLFVKLFNDLKFLINVANKKIIFEGTDRSKKNLTDLKKSLNINIKLIKKSLNLC